MRSTDFCSPYRHGFLRVAASTLRTSIADPRGNAESVLRVARECQDEGVALVVFPELTLTGYSIEDVLLQDTLLGSVETALLDVMAGSADLVPLLVVGAPLRYRHRIYNCAVLVHRGTVLGRGHNRRVQQGSAVLHGEMDALERAGRQPG